MLVGTSCGDASSRGALEKAELNQIWLVDIHNRVRLFTRGSGKGFDSHWTAVKFINNGDEDAAVDVVQSEFIDVKHCKRAHRNVARDFAVAVHLSEVTNPFEQPIGNSRCAARSQRYFPGAFIVHGRIKDRRGTADD